MPPELTSARSARVTEVRHLYDRRHRAERGAFVVEGPQAVREALRSGILELYVTEAAGERHAEIVAGALEQGARVSGATDAVLAAMSETRQPQGLLAVCPLVSRPLADVLDAAFSADRAPAMLIVLDGVADPGNAGTIIRSAHAMGAGGVVFTGGSVDPHNGKCVRSTAGSLFHIPVATAASAADVLQACREADVRILIADSHAREALDDRVDLLTGPLAWVFGSEAHGVGDEWRGHTTDAMRIPMAAGAESLNLAAAAAICLFATARARA